MRYQHSREQSAEILRLAITLMGRQPAGFYPASYALWYEHAAGVNPALSCLLEKRIAEGRLLSDADVARLYAQHIATPEGEAIEQLKQRLLALLQETGQIVSNTGVHAVRFGEALEGRSHQLKQPVEEHLLHGIVSELLSQTDHMRTVNTTLAQQLQASASEVSTLTKRLEQVQSESLKDPLSGLLNRRGFEHAVAELSGAADRVQGAALLLFDIDNFKQVNDTHGHLLGDQVLRTVSQILRARIKGADIAMRLGGDEFVIFLPETSILGGKTVAEDIRAMVMKSRWSRVDLAEHLERVTLSAGIAHAGGGERFEDLMRRADAALYRAKRDGRDRVVVAEPVDAAAESVKAVAEAGKAVAEPGKAVAEPGKMDTSLPLG